MRFWTFRPGNFALGVEIGGPFKAFLTKKKTAKMDTPALPCSLQKPNDS